MNGWVKILLGAGPLGAIIAFLLLQSAGIIPSEAGEMKEMLRTHAEQTRLIQQSQLDALIQIQQSQKEAARLLKVQCIKNAQTDQDRQNCL